MRTTVTLALLVSVFLVSCGGSEEDKSSAPSAAHALATNEGGFTEAEEKVAQENCNSIINNYCVIFENCTEGETSKEACETELKTEVDCDEALGEPDHDDVESCFDDIEAIDCGGFDGAWPQSCDGIFVFAE